MSKQTNIFQQLIHYIHHKIEGYDAIVTESAMLCEQSINEKIPREIDILIEKRVSKKLIRIAIECRDRKAKDDIQWVDSLIGKYSNLPIQKIIAVSNSGYTKAAQLKAAINHIELKTFQEALNIDFNNEFIKLGILNANFNFKLEQIYFEFHDSSPHKLNPQLQIFKDQYEIATLGELVSFCFEEGLKEKGIPYISKNFLNIFKMKSDLKKQILIKHKTLINNLFIKSLEGSLHELLSLTLIIIGHPIIEEVELRYKTYNSALIGKGKISADEFGKECTCYIVQTTQKIEENTIVNGKLFYKYKKYCKI